MAIAGSPIIPSGCSFYLDIQTRSEKFLTDFQPTKCSEQTLDSCGHITWPAGPPVVPYASFISLDIPSLFLPKPLDKSSRLGVFEKLAH